MRLRLWGYAHFLESGPEFRTTVGEITDEGFNRTMEIIWRHDVLWYSTLKWRNIPCKTGFFLDVIDAESSSLLTPLGRIAWRPANPVFFNLPPTEPVPVAITSSKAAVEPAVLLGTISLTGSSLLSLSLSWSVISCPWSESPFGRGVGSSSAGAGPP